jgi:hypothetical protein
MLTLAEEITFAPSNYIKLTPPGDVYLWASFVMTAIITFPPGVERVEPALRACLRLWRVEGDGILLASEDLKVTETSDESFIEGEVIKEDGRYKARLAWNCRITDVGTHYFGVTFQGSLPNEEYVHELEATTDPFYCYRA